MTTAKRTTSDSAVRRRFDFYVRVFRHAGIPIFFTKIPKLFTIYDIACNISTWMTTTAILMDIIMNTEGLETSMETLRMASPLTMITGMYSFARWRVAAITRLMVLTESFSMKYVEATDPGSVSSSMSRWIPRVKMIVRSLIRFSLMSITIYSLIRILSKTNQSLTFNAWYPYDASVSPAFELTLFTQMVGCYVYANMLYGFGGLYATIATMVCMELQDIRANILNIEEVGVVDMFSSAQNDQKGEQSYNYEAEFGPMQQHLNECVRRHQYVLSYIQVMERTLNPIMAEILLLQLISLCMVSFSVITSWGNGNEMMLSMAAYSVILVSVACYCWFGSEIYDQAEQVRDAAYGCDWIGAPISLQRCVAMIITITNKEVVLTAGKFAPLNIKTMMNMISQSLSYFMFLLEVKNKFSETEYVDNL